MAEAVLAEGAHLGLQLVNRLFKGAQAVAARVIPRRCHDQCCGEKLVAGQAAAAAGQRGLIVGQAPAHVEGLAENHGAVPGEDRLEPQLRRHGVDGDGTVQQPPGRDGVGQQGDAAGGVGRAEMAGAVACAGFGMALDHDAGGGMIGQRLTQHPAKGGGIGDRGVAKGLVDDQHIAGGGWGQVWVVDVVF